jgi:DNA topoisomerase-1
MRDASGLTVARDLLAQACPCTGTRHDRTSGRIARRIRVIATAAVNVVVDSEALAGIADAGLRYVNSDEPGFSRCRCGRGFRYLDVDGESLRDTAVKRRLAALAVPPAWSGVWYCKDPRGHIQATGRDERGRKQYVYHADWREMRDRSKFAQLATFARALTTLRKRIDKDLKSFTAREAAVLAAAAQLLDLTGIRVGNRSYFEENGTVGLTTLQKRHMNIDGDRIGLCFKAKSGRPIKLTVSDRKLARILLRCEELPGQQLFHYRCEDGIRQVDSASFNAYLRTASGADISAKDFRTWIATVTVIETWLESGDRPLKIKEATGTAARRLANTPAVARRSYIHPAILELVTSRPPTETERRSSRRDGVHLSGAELLCARLLQE